VYVYVGGFAMGVFTRMYVCVCVGVVKSILCVGVCGFVSEFGCGCVYMWLCCVCLWYLCGCGYLCVCVPSHVLVYVIVYVFMSVNLSVCIRVAPAGSGNIQN